MRVAVVVGFSWLVVGACSSPPKATPEAAQKACVRHVELGYWEGFERSLKDRGEALDDAARQRGEVGLAEALGSADGRQIVAKCVEDYTKLATQTQVECVAAATTQAAAKACVGGP